MSASSSKALYPPRVLKRKREYDQRRTARAKSNQRLVSDNPNAKSMCGWHHWSGQPRRNPPCVRLPTTPLHLGLTLPRRTPTPVSLNPLVAVAIARTPAAPVVPPDRSLSNPLSHANFNTHRNLWPDKPGIANSPPSYPPKRNRPGPAFGCWPRPGTSATPVSPEYPRARQLPAA